MKEYFSPLRRFKLREHPFDIGRPFSWWKGHYDRHFLNNMYERQESEFAAFYQYHLTYFLKVNEGTSEAEFFKHVWDLVNDGIATLIKEDNPDSKSKHERTNVKKVQLRTFIGYLNTINTFNARPAHLVVAEKDAIIARQQEQISLLEKRLKELNEFEVAQKIRIEDNFLPTLIDLIRQLRELTLPNQRMLLRCDYKTPYYKMISKYFSYNGKDIPIETAKNYFSDKQNEVTVKGTSISVENKLFRITNVNPTETDKKSNQA